VGKGSAEAVAAETLEAHAIGGGHCACGVEAEALDVGAKAGWGLGFGQGVKESLGGDRRHHGLGHGAGQVGLGLVGGSAVLPLERASGQGSKAEGDLARDLLDLLIRGRRQGGEGQSFIGTRDEQPVGQQAVKMRVKIERSAEALDEGHGAGPPVSDSQRAAAPPHPGQEGLQIGSYHAGEEKGVEGQGETKTPRKGQHVLAVGRLGQDAVDQVGGGVGRMPGPATRTEAALAGEGNEALETARGTAQPGEPAREKAAAEVAVELVLDEGRVAFPGRAAESCFVKQRIEVIEYQAVEDGGVRLAWTVEGSRGRSRGARLPLVDNGREGSGSGGNDRTWRICGPHAGGGCSGHASGDFA
jgi:hypothetical protein